MKHSLTVMTIGALVSVTLLAQRPFGSLTSSTPPDPATIVADQVARLTSLLTLTPAQVTQATTIFTNALSAVTPLQTSLNTDRTSLTAAEKADSTATIDQLSASIGTLTGQIIAIQSKADAAFYVTLTPAQQAILDSNNGFGRGGFGSGGPGGPGPGGPH